MQTSASVPDQQDGVMPDLPAMGQFIATMDGSVQYSEQLLESCSICWEDFNWDNGVAVRLPCGHILHDECCLNWMNSASENRNACPMCRTVFCLHNALTPEQIRDNEEEHNEAVYNREAFYWLMAYADSLYDGEIRTGHPDLVYMLCEVRRGWHLEHHHQAHEFICHWHEEIGDNWLELVVANHIRNRLSEDGLADSRASQELETRRSGLVNCVNWMIRGSNLMGEVWVPQNMQEFEARAAENAGDNEDHQQEQHDDDRQADEDPEDYERWASAHTHEHEEGSEEGEIREHATTAESSELRHPESFELSDPEPSPTNSGTIEQAIIARNDAIHQRFREELNAEIVVGALHELHDFRSAEILPYGEVQRRHSRSQSPSPSSPTPPSPSPSTDSLFSLPPATELADLPPPNPTVSQQDVADTRSWLRSKGHTILCEMHNVASVVYQGDGTYDVHGFEGDDMGVVRDADAYHVVGWIAIFYRYGENGGDVDGSRGRVLRPV